MAIEFLHFVWWGKPTSHETPGNSVIDGHDTLGPIRWAIKFATLNHRRGVQTPKILFWCKQRYEASYIELFDKYKNIHVVSVPDNLSVSSFAEIIKPYLRYDGNDSDRPELFEDIQRLMSFIECRKQGNPLGDHPRSKVDVKEALAYFIITYFKNPAYLDTNVCPNISSIDDLPNLFDITGNYIMVPNIVDGLDPLTQEKTTQVDCWLLVRSSTFIIENSFHQEASSSDDAKLFFRLYLDTQKVASSKYLKEYEMLHKFVPFNVGNGNIRPIPFSEFNQYEQERMVKKLQNTFDQYLSLASTHPIWLVEFLYQCSLLPRGLQREVLNNVLSFLESSAIEPEKIIPDNCFKLNPRPSVSDRPEDVTSLFTILKKVLYEANDGNCTAVIEQFNTFWELVVSSETIHNNIRFVKLDTEKTPVNNRDAIATVDHLTKIYCNSHRKSGDEQYELREIENRSRILKNYDADFCQNLITVVYTLGVRELPKSFFHILISYATCSFPRNQTGKVSRHGKHQNRSSLFESNTPDDDDTANHSNPSKSLSLMPGNF